MSANRALESASMRTVAWLLALTALVSFQLPWVVCAEAEVHLHFPWAYELATHPRILDAIEDLLV